MKTVRAYFEGNDDKAILEALARVRLLPNGLELAKRDPEKGGKDGLVNELWPFVDPTMVGGHAVVLVDYDDSTAEQLGVWFGKLLAEKGQNRVAVESVPAGQTNVRRYRLSAEGRTGGVVLCPVGLPEDAELKDLYGLRKFAMDEYALRLVRSEVAYTATGDFRALPHATALLKMIEVGDLFRKNGLDVTKSKTHLQIVRAAAQIRPATATLYKRLVAKAAGALPPDEFRRLMSPLIDDIHEAVRLLTTP